MTFLLDNDVIDEEGDDMLSALMSSPSVTTPFHYNKKSKESIHHHDIEGNELDELKVNLDDHSITSGVSSYISSPSPSYLATPLNQANYKSVNSDNSKSNKSNKHYDAFPVSPNKITKSNDKKSRAKLSYSNEVSFTDAINFVCQKVKKFYDSNMFNYRSYMSQRTTRVNNPFQSYRFINESLFSNQFANFNKKLGGYILSQLIMTPNFTLHGFIEFLLSFCSDWKTIESPSRDTGVNKSASKIAVSNDTITIDLLALILAELAIYMNIIDVETMALSYATDSDIVSSNNHIIQLGYTLGLVSALDSLSANSQVQNDNDGFSIPKLSIKHSFLTLIYDLMFLTSSNTLTGVRNSVLALSDGKRRVLLQDISICRTTIAHKVS